MNKNKWKLEVFKWIFSHFRTVDLNIFLNPVDGCTFYRFKRINFKILEDEMTMVVLISLRVLAASELFHSQRKFCLIHALGDDKKKITGKLTYTILSSLYFTSLYSLQI